MTAVLLLLLALLALAGPAGAISCTGEFASCAAGTITTDNCAAYSSPRRNSTDTANECKRLPPIRFAADCTAETGGEPGEWCEDSGGAGQGNRYACWTTDGNCNTAAEWKQVALIKVATSCSGACSGEEFCRDTDGALGTRVWICQTGAWTGPIDNPFGPDITGDEWATVVEPSGTLDLDANNATLKLNDCTPGATGVLCAKASASTIAAYVNGAERVVATQGGPNATFILPQGTGSAPTAEGSIFWKTDESGTLVTRRLYAGNGSTAVPIRERASRGWRLSNSIANAHCTASTVPDACCTGDLTGTCAGQRIASSSTITTGHVVKVWNLENEDTDNYYDFATNRSTVTIPTGLAGKYILECSVVFTDGASDSGGRCVMLVSGTVSKMNCCPHAGGTSSTACNVAMSANLAAAASVTCQVWQGSGTSDIDAAPSPALTTLTSFSGRFLGE